MNHGRRSAPSVTAHQLTYKPRKEEEEGTEIHNEEERKDVLRKPSCNIERKIVNLFFLSCGFSHSEFSRKKFTSMSAC